jgi:pantetheine-phosphate adenylyltransferase
MKTIAVYAGSFDPLTLGHLDLIQRTAEIFDRVILAIAAESSKTSLFTLEERVDLTQTAVKGLGKVEVESFDGLAVDFVRSRGAEVMIRGVRAHSDFEYEFRMALTNRKLAPEIETLFMMPNESHSYVSSSLVKEVAELGGDVSGFVTPEVQAALVKKFAG